MTTWTDEENGGDVFSDAETGGAAISAYMKTLIVAGSAAEARTTLDTPSQAELTAAVATGLSTAVTKDGQTTTTARVPFAEGISNGSKTLTALAAGTASTEAANVGQIQSSAAKLIGSVAGTNTITGALSPALTAYASGQQFILVPANTNTGATTLEIVSGSAKNVFWNGAACVGGELRQNIPAIVEYDGTQFQIVGNGFNAPFLDSHAIVEGSSDSTKKARLEVDGLTTATTRVLTVQDEDGTLALTSEFDYSNVAGSPGRMPFPSFWIQGLTQSLGVDTSNDVTISAGQARDAANAQNMILGSALTKQIDASWAVGDNAGGLDTGSVAINTRYYIWLIKRSDTGVVDALFSASASAPTMPANYDAKRLVGFVMTDGSAQLRAFTSYELHGGGLDYFYKSPQLDIDLSNTLTTSRRTDALSVPAAFSVIANLNTFVYDATSTAHVYLYNPDCTDLAPVTNASPLFSVHSTTAYEGNSNVQVRTSSTGTIAARADLATVDTYRVATLGFEWARRN